MQAQEARASGKNKKTSSSHFGHLYSVPITALVKPDNDMMAMGGAWGDYYLFAPILQIQKLRCRKHKGETAWLVSELPDVPLASCVVSSRLLTLSVPQFLGLCNEAETLSLQNIGCKD